MASKGVLDTVLRALGINPIQARWRARRFWELQKRRLRSLENRSRSVTYQNKRCEGCGLTVSADERKCPRCGARLSGVATRQLKRLWRLFVPEGTYTYTSLILVTNIAFYLVMMMRSGGTAALGRSIDPRVIVRFGAWTVPLVTEGQPWRLLTPIFLHFDILHLIFNCLWLVQLGPLLEQRYGRSRFLVGYLVCGVAGFAASVLYRWPAWHMIKQLAGASAGAAAGAGAGASGSIFGMIGIALVVGYLKRPPGSDELRGGLIKWALYGLVFSLLPGVDLMAHLGGGAAGFLFGLLLDGGPDGALRHRRIWLAAEGLALGITMASFALVAVHGV